MKIVNENIVLFDQKLWIKETIYNVIEEIQFADVKSFENDDQNNLLIRFHDDHFHDDHFGRRYRMSAGKEGKRILGEIKYSFEIWKRLTETVRAIYDCSDICCPIVVTNYKTKKITISI